MKPAYTSLLVCPLCQGKLKLAETTDDNGTRQELWCVYDGLAFPIAHDTPIMLVSQARPLTSEEKLRKQRSFAPKSPL